MTRVDPASPADAAARVLAELARRGQTLAVAESLTGGLLAGRLTAVAGASRAFRGAVTAYATDVKRDLLGVDGDLLDRRGAVDAEVARRMAGGARQALRADWGVATTGVAGPDPQDGKPVGLVFVAVAGPPGSGRPAPGGPGEAPLGGRARAVELLLTGDRAGVREGAVQGALDLLWAELTVR